MLIQVSISSASDSARLEAKLAAVLVAANQVHQGVEYLFNAPGPKAAAIWANDVRSLFDSRVVSVGVVRQSGKALFQVVLRTGLKAV